MNPTQQYPGASGDPADPPSANRPRPRPLRQSASARRPGIAGAAAITLALAGLGLTACGDPPERVLIEETRVISAREPQPKVNAYDGERFGLHPMSWTVPQGWRQVGPATMRFVDMRFGPDGEGEAFVSALTGDGGGLLANVNRWRAEMDLEPIQEADLQNMETMNFLGGPALKVDIEGDYRPVGATRALENYRMIGLIQPSSELTFFVKMTGPADLVEQERERFEQFLRSVRVRSTGQS